MGRTKLADDVALDEDIGELFDDEFGNVDAENDDCIRPELNLLTGSDRIMW